jgi:hypothetical protein
MADFEITRRDFHKSRRSSWNREDEQFVNDPEANKLLTKQYCKPWNLT